MVAEFDKGKQVVAQSGCLACHKIGENGNDGPGPELTDIASRLPSAPVQFSTEETRIKVTCGSAKFTLLSMPVAEYPTLPQVAEQSVRISCRSR